MTAFLKGDPPVFVATIAPAAPVATAVLMWEHSRQIQAIAKREGGNQ